MWLGTVFWIYMDMQGQATYWVWIHLVLPPYTQGERRKTIFSQLESNPGPLASQETALTTRPCLPIYENNYSCRTLNRWPWQSKFLPPSIQIRRDPSSAPETTIGWISTSEPDSSSQIRVRILRSVILALCRPRVLTDLLTGSKIRTDPLLQP